MISISRDNLDRPMGPVYGMLARGCQPQLDTFDRYRARGGMDAAGLIIRCESRDVAAGMQWIG